MPSQKSRAAARRRAWGRGPVILRFEPLESRRLLAATSVAALPDLVASEFHTLPNLDWGASFHAVGKITNQGTGTVTSPYTVDIFASTSPQIGPGSVLLGEATLPAGLAPGASSPFDQVVSLPATPIPGMGTAQVVYVGLWVNPSNTVVESNTYNNLGIGQGYDTSDVTITARQPARLVGTSLGVYPDATTWGSTVSLTSQMHNNAQGDAPPTRARIVLTPSGAIPGGINDVTVGDVAVPAIPAWATVNLVQSIALPAGPPIALASSTRFTLSMIPDADFVTNRLYPAPAPQGFGLDQAMIQINPGANANVPQAPPPSLAASTVLAPTTPILWGQNFQVATSVQNIGQGDAGAFKVRFLLIGANGTVDHALFLGDATVTGLKAGYNQDVVQTLKLPGRVPAGLTLNSTGVGKIAVVVDPEHRVNEPPLNNKYSESGPVILQLPGAGNTGTVPTTPPVSTVPVATPAPRPAPTPKPQRGKIHRQAPPKKEALTAQVEHQLRVFPGHVTHWFNGILKKKK